jgi:Uma2 family endonuclease
MADNTLQFEWIVALQGNLDLLFADNPDVFVAGDHLIYPVEGDDLTRQAPDVYVAFGRPKGHRGSYRVFMEDRIFPQVIFEVWSPSNTAERMNEKRKFYEKYGAEEYYVVYPDFPEYLQGWVRAAGASELVAVPEMNGFVSPRLGIRFASVRGAIAVFLPDGSPCRTLQLGTLQRETQSFADEAAERADTAQLEADAQRARAEAAEGEAEDARREVQQIVAQRNAERERAERLAAKLRELGLDPDAQ